MTGTVQKYMQEILFSKGAFFAAALLLMLCYYLKIISREKTNRGTRHLAVMFACEYPLSPPPLKDKPGQGLLQHASLKIACSLTPPLHERALGYGLLAKQKATLGEGYNNGKIDRRTYGMHSPTNPGCPGGQ